MCAGEGSWITSDSLAFINKCLSKLEVDPIAAFVVFLSSFSDLLWGSMGQHPLCRQAAGFSVSGQNPVFTSHTSI